MLVEALVIKGVIAFGHFVAAHATAGVIAGTIHAVAGMSLAQLVTATVTVGFVTGCITWTADRVKNVKNGVKAIEDGNYLKAVAEFGKFAISTNSDVNLLPDTIVEGLDKMGVDHSASLKVGNWVRTNESAIGKYVKSHK